MTAKMALMEYFKNNQHTGNIFCMVEREVDINPENGQEAYGRVYIKRIKDFKHFHLYLNGFDKNLKLRYSIGGVDIIDFYFSNDIQEEYKDKYTAYEYTLCGKTTIENWATVERHSDYKQDL